MRDKGIQALGRFYMKYTFIINSMCPSCCAMYLLHWLRYIACIQRPRINYLYIHHIICSIYPSYCTFMYFTGSTIQHALQHLRKAMRTCACLYSFFIFCYHFYNLYCIKYKMILNPAPRNCLINLQAPGSVHVCVDSCLFLIF